MALAVENGKLIVEGGSLGTGSECCCGPPPPPPPPPCEGTCCIDGVCSSSTKADCVAAGGTFYKCEESCSPSYCASPPSCETLECTAAEWDTAVVTIDIDTFSDVQSDTALNTASCTSSYKAIWQGKVEELNGTYTLSYAGLDGSGNPHYTYTSGTLGTTGYLSVLLTLQTPFLNTSGVACSKRALVSVSLINLSENGSELYYAPFQQFLCVGPGQLFPLTGSKVAASTASNGATAEFYIDMCDGESLSVTTAIEGQYQSEPSCRTFQCLNFEYSGTAAVTLTNA